jgi:hypothetical protein
MAHQRGSSIGHGHVRGTAGGVSGQGERYAEAQNDQAHSSERREGAERPGPGRPVPPPASLNWL